ncbi:MAG TPA: hypothetical protein VFG10_17745 [Saprospiraceae bacterium]|nr:hypothetical protein [Saprospiraceae bacterium]
MSKIIGTCCICGEERVLTFEHFPPQSAGNKSPVFMQRADNILPINNVLYGKKSRSHKGLGDKTLCQSCNNNTGSCYGNSYSSFATQGLKILQERKLERDLVRFKLDIQPLNVFKQILAIFCSTDRAGYLRGLPQMKNFLLIPDSKTFPSGFKLYMYCTLSNQHRCLGMSSTLIPEIGIGKYCEFNFRPYGFILAEQSLPPEDSMQDITGFLAYGYNEKAEINLQAPYLTVSSPYLAMYG